VGHELVSNRKAYHQYHILETVEAGIVLLGTEIKSLRAHGGSLQEAYVKILKDEIWLIGAHIAPYKFGGLAYNHEERRDRKLLLHRREIEKLEGRVREKGMTLVPLAMYLKQGRVKISVGLAKGKQLHDKRHALIEKEKRREMDRAIKRFKQ